jgi:opacity protein-like surface antigen
VRTARAVLAVVLASALCAPVAAEPGWYGFGSFGRSSFDDAGAQPALSGGDDKDNGARLGAGYMFGEHVGVEAGWIDFGKAKRGGAVPGLSPAREGDIRANGPFVAGVASLSLGARLSAYGKLGVIDARMEASPDADAGIAGFFESTSDWRPMLGIGGAWQISRSWALQTEYGTFTRIADRARAAETKVSMVSVGMVFRLG